MICNRCKNQINNISSFCPNCGNNLQNNIKRTNINFTKSQKITIISMLCIIIIMLTTLIVSSNSSQGTSRTIMIYVVGSNLETDAKIVSKDLSAIKSEKIDLNKVNILLYTGGTEKWHNFISNEDNGIYKLESTGFKKLESQQQLNLGDPNTLTSFLKYGYENYNADKFDLILYNHGGAIDGAIYDDISGDNLSLSDMEIALKNSPFNENNKIETVLFRTCLNGTIELSNVFNDYAEYLIGSEEVSYGSAFTDVLGFLNDVKYSDNGLDYGKKFVNAYEEQMNVLDPNNSVTRTYSVIDLSKINNLNKELDTYIASIDLTRYYDSIAKTRANVFQYGSDAGTSDYDMIDLYEFIEKTKDYATKSNQDLLDAIDKAIVYNKTNNMNSHGLSIYFPYSGKKGMQNKFIGVYSNLNFSKEYKNFITKFHTMKNSQTAFKFDLSKNEPSTEFANNKLSIQLTQEQMNNYSFATFIILERDTEHPNYYKPIHNTDEVVLNEDGMLTANYKDKLIKIKNDDQGYEYILTFNRKSIRRATAIIYDEDKELTDDNFMSIANLYFSENQNGNPIISTAKLISDNERIDGILLNLNDYEKYELWQYSYRILDDKGNVLDSSEWERPPEIIGYGGNLSELEMKYSSLDTGDNYYGLFIINDINGNSSYSKLIKIGE